MRRTADGPAERFKLSAESGWSATRLAISYLGMPNRPGGTCRVRLEVKVNGDRERWIPALFPGRTFASTQSAEGSLLMESFGLSSFSSAVVVDRSSLCYEFRRAWFAGVALPAWLSPYVDGRVQAVETGWQVAVHVFAPFLGEIFHYEGWVEPE